MAHHPEPAPAPAPAARPRPETRETEVPAHRITRRPADGWVLAEPYPMGRRTRRALRGVIAAFCPLRTGPAPEDIVDRVEDQMRRLMAYFHPVLARLFTVAIRILDWSPVWRLRHLRPVHALPRDAGAAVVNAVAHSRLALVRDVAFMTRAAVLSAYFDQPDVHRALGYEPVGWLESRVAVRRRLLAGGGEPALIEPGVPGGAP